MSEAAVPPIPFRANGGVMTPMGAEAAKAAARLYADGSVTWLVPHYERSLISHRHQFAWLKEAFNNLPEDYLGVFSDAEHLRKYALIRTGYRTQKDIACATESAATQLAAWANLKDRYAVAVINEVSDPDDGTSSWVVSIYEAESQSKKAMGRERFQKSKDDVLGFVANLLGIEPGALVANAGKSA